MEDPVLHPGDAGAAVGALQQALVEVGEQISQEELSPQAYRATTEAAVRVFQSTHGLAVDGVVGKATWHALTGGAGSDFIAPGWSYDQAGTRPQLQPVLKSAIALIGTLEQPAGSNRGPLIDGWNLAAGIPIGSPWCASFATAQHQLGQGYKLPILGSAFKVAAWGREQSRLVPADRPVLPGDIGVILRGDGHGHVVLIAGDQGGGHLATVEGNAANAVRGMLRGRSSFAVIVRPLAVG